MLQQVAQLGRPHHSPAAFVIGLERIDDLGGQVLHFGVGVHNVQEVGEADLAVLRAQVAGQLVDGGRQAQGPHDHRDLVQVRNHPGTGEQVEALAEF